MVDDVAGGGRGLAQSSTKLSVTSSSFSGDSTWFSNGTLLFRQVETSPRRHRQKVLKTANDSIAKVNNVENVIFVIQAEVVIW